MDSRQNHTTRTPRRLQWIAALVVLTLSVPVQNALGGDSVAEEVGESVPVVDGSPPSAAQAAGAPPRTLADMAAYVAGVGPDSEDARFLADQLDQLESLPGVYHTVAHQVLSGLAEAQHHHERAVRHLTPDQRLALREAPHGGPLSAEAAQALGKVDLAEVTAAQAALQRAAWAVTRALDAPPPVDGIQRSLANALDQDPDAPWGAALPRGGATPERVAGSMVRLIDADAPTRSAMEEQLQEVPPGPLSALYQIFEAARPFSEGLASESDLLILAAALDEAGPVLELWAATQLVHELAQGGPRMALPDPSRRIPDLGFATSGPDRGDDTDALPLQEALRNLALATGDPTVAGDAEDHAASILLRVDQEQADALARLFEAAAVYAQAEQQIQDIPFHDDVGYDFLEGDLPAVGTPEADALLDAVPALESHHDAMTAMDAMMTATEEVMGAFAPDPPSGTSSGHDLSEDEIPSPDDVPGLLDDEVSELMDDVPTLDDEIAEVMDELPPAPEPADVICEEPPVIVPGIFAFDACERKNTWANQTLIALDVGGDDTYTHRAGAPFSAILAEEEEARVLGFNILLDLGGSDTYDAVDARCSQGAACISRDAGLDAGAGNGSFSLLVDWAGASTNTTNRFAAGSQSQGYADPTTGRRAVGMLVESAGPLGKLNSVYSAGDHSQGSGNPTSGGGGGSYGVLVRTIGAEAQAIGRFVAGTNSQGAATPVGQLQYVASGSAFVNVADVGARSHDSYEAGTNSQGSVNMERDTELNDFGHSGFALFADAVLEGGASNDTYEAGINSQGYAERPEGTMETPSPLGIPGRSVNLQEQEPLFLDAVLPADFFADPGVDADPDGPSISWRPGATGTSHSDDQYLGGFRPGEGLGGGVGHQDGRPTFVDIGGTDTYDVSGWPPGEAPGNDQTWENGTDMGFKDGDNDVFPSFLEFLAGSDPQDGEETPAPTGIPFVIDLRNRDDVRSGAHSIVIDLGGNDLYKEDFSALVHLDLSGNDRYEGRAAAGGPAQSLLSLLVDVAGDDEYDTSIEGAQGYGGYGSAGLLFDLSGSDDYTAPDHAQGAAQLGGIGVLVDGRGSSRETNVFRSGAHSQGHASNGTTGLNKTVHGASGEDVPETPVEGVPNGIAVLLAMGDHNTVDDGETPAGVSSKGEGVSVNLGDNDAPEIRRVQVFNTAGALLYDSDDEEESPVELEAGESYRFKATVEDDDDDDVDVRWSFQHGDTQQDNLTTTRSQHLLNEGQKTLVSQITFGWNETYRAVTDRHDPNRTESATYEGSVQVVDPGGARSAVVANSYKVRNTPPELLGSIEGPDGVAVGQEAYFQLPFVPAGDMRNVSLQVDWGDGEQTTNDGDAIDWASLAAGGRIRLPDAVPIAGSGTGPVDVSNENPTPNMIDSHEDSEAIFTYSPERASSPAIHFFVDLDGVRNIGTVALDAWLGQNEDPITFAVEGIGPDGRSTELGFLKIKGSEEETVALELPDRPPLSSVLFRQVVDTTDERHLSISSVHLMGPGASHVWQNSGDHTINMTVVDAYGGRNSTDKNLSVMPGFNPLPELSPEDVADGKIHDVPLRLDDVAGRGVVRHASIPLVTNAYGDPQAQVELTLNVTENAEEGATVCIQWGDNQEKSCQDKPEDVGQMTFQHSYLVPSDPDPMVQVQYQNGTWKNVTRLHLEEAFELRSNEGEPLLFLALDPDRTGETTWYSDASDRSYFAIVDAAGNDRFLNMNPTLLVDREGDDDHLSTIPGTQGFATTAQATFFLDVAGDDVYVSPGQGQGAATKGGSAVFMDLGGDDRFNPVSAHSTTNLQGFPKTWETWTDRPDPLDPLPVGRAELRPNDASLVQGAAMDGSAVLLVHGGSDHFNAGERSQGFAMHDSGVERIEDYLVPNRECLDQTLSPIGGTDPLSDITSAELNESAVLCAIGIDDKDGTPIAGGGDTIPFNVGPLTTFLLNGPRYGPSSGMLLHTDGTASYHAGQLSQGASQAQARGILLDADGAFAAGATNASQAYTRHGGLGGLLTGGHHTTALESEGQGWVNASHDPRPESPSVVEDQTDPGMAVYAAPYERDRTCEKQCPDAKQLENLEPDPEDLSPGNVRLPNGLGNGPEMELNLGDPLLWTYHENELDLTISLAGDGEAELVVLTQPLRDSDGEKCIGAPLAPATSVMNEVVVLGEEHSLTLKLSDDGADGPLFPAGCTRIIAFARGVDDSGVPQTEWSKLTGDIRLLPQPRLVLEAPSRNATGAPLLVTDGGDIQTALVTHEPLAVYKEGKNDGVFDLEFRAVNATGVSSDLTVEAGDAEKLDAPEFGLRLDYTIEIPGDFLHGEYELQVKANWTDDEWDGATWDEVGSLILDKEPPTVDFDPLESTLWRGPTSIPLSGDVVDVGSDVKDLRVRLIDGSCTALQTESCVVDLHQPSHLIDTRCEKAGNDWSKCVTETVPHGGSRVNACPEDWCDHQELDEESGSSVQAALSPNGTQWEWHAVVKTTASFLGGPVQVQVKATDLGDRSTEWITEGDDLLIDKEAPTLVALRSKAGTNATNEYNDEEPIQFDATLEDCAASGQQCTPGSGSGLDFNKTTARIYNAHNALTQEAVTLPAASFSADGNVTFNWTGSAPAPGAEAGPEPGVYDVQIQAMDNAGNILILNPGVPFVVDRSPPVLKPSTFTVELPEGQTAMKPGDELSVAVEANDVLPGIRDVVVTFEADANATSVLPELQPPLFGGMVTVPDGLLPAGQEDGGIPVTLNVTAVDEAGNQASFEALAGPAHKPIQYVEDEFGIDGLTSSVRSESLVLSWDTSRPVQITHARLIDPVGTTVDGTVETDGESHEVVFRGLLDNATYEVDVEMRDAAHFTRNIADPLDPLDPPLTSIDTPVRADTDIVTDNMPAFTHSGEIEIKGVLDDAVPGNLSLHVGSLDATPVETQAIDVAPGEDMNVPYAFTFDSRAVVPESTERAVEVPVFVRMDDGATVWNRSQLLRIDNAPPAVAPHVQGADPVEGWYNTSVVVASGASDNTTPMHHRVRAGDVLWIDSDRIRLDQDGIHVVAFNVSDGAVPPNTGNASIEVKVDRVPPALDASVLLDAPATNGLEVPLSVTADAGDSADTSPFHGYRVRVGDNVSAWNMTPPTDIFLPSGTDGVRWIGIEARDAAANVAVASLPVMVDRAAPALVDARWVGADENGTPVLHVVASDGLLNATGPGSGVDRLRVGSETEGTITWQDWIPASGNDAFPVPEHNVSRLMIQVADQAGNEVGPLPLPEWNHTMRTDDPTSVSEHAPDARLRFEATHLAPREGTTDTHFAFSAIVTPLHGPDPDAVWLDLNGERTEMEPVGPRLSEGGRLYVESLQLEASSMDDPYMFKIIATTGDHTAESPVEPGPLVHAVGWGGEAAAQNQGRGIPSTGFTWLAGALLAALVVARRWDGRGRSP